jgi:putative tricarboxylic transport membrane protein
MIPLLTLGIPGSGATAVMMGAFLLHGIQPGPLLFSKSPESVYTVFAGMLVCNLIMILAGLITAKFFSELMRVPENILSAFIISFCILGAFALRNDMTDVWFMAIFGIVGYFMRRYNLPSPPLILGLILGPLAEKYFLTSMIGAGNDFSIFFRRPVSGCLMFISIALLLMPFLRSLGKRGKKRVEAA